MRATQRKCVRTKLPLIIAGLSLAAFAVKAGPPPAPAGYKWEVVSNLTDEFNDGWVDTGKWYKYNPYWIGRAPGLFNESQVTESGGYLRLKNTKFADTSQQYWVYTGFLASKNKESFYAGMYSECKMKCARDGTVTGFWMSKPQSGGKQEIDVQEGVGWPANGNWNLTKQMRMNTHSYSGLVTPKNYWIGSGVGDAYHTYGVWWRDKRNITMYYGGGSGTSTSFSMSEDFTGGMQLNINTETQDWIGDPNVSFLADNSRNETLVDYVRTWKLVPDTSSGIPYGSYVSFKAVANSKYVCADGNLNANQYPLAANRTSVGSWEKFKVVDAGGGYVYLIANANGKYVYSNGSLSDWPLIAASTTTGTWGKYQWISNGDGTVSLKCIANGKYVCADKGVDPTNVKLITNRSSIGSWEKFWWQKQ